MNWFGQSWGAPICDPETHVGTPAGARCDWCTEPVAADDSGVTMGAVAWPPYQVHYHRNCWMRQVVGSVGHQHGMCSCRGRDVGDPTEMTPRQAADAAVAAFYGQHA